MKNIVIASMLALSFGFCSAASALNSYSPPDQIICKLDAMNNLSCTDFNRNYLVEHTHTADFPNNQSQLFNFYSAVAYFTPDHTEYQVFYTYHNAANKNVQLMTTNKVMGPDLSHGNWKLYKDEFYNCQGGAGACAITHLPNKKN